MGDKRSILKDLRRRASALHAYSDNNELYSIVGSLIQRDLTTSKCRELISTFEEKHLFYFALFKPQIENPKKSWIENAKRDITNIRKNTAAPSLRECYAISEVISRNVVLMCEYEEDGFRGIEIEPVVSEKDNKNDTPLILFLRFDEENVHFIRCDENINRFIDCGLTITNGKHLKCLDKRFRNNFDTLRHFLLDSEFHFFSCYSFPDAFPVEMTNMFELFAQIIYGTQTNEKGVKDLIKAHVEADDYIQVYMQLVNVQENVSKNIQKNEKKAVKLEAQLTKESFRKRMIDWKAAEKVHLFALASLFNAEIYVVSPEDVSGREVSDLYLPICGSYLYTFESPLVFKIKKGSTSFEVNFEKQCQCCRKTPEIIGEFPIANNAIDLERIRSLDLIPCCPPKSRHGLHEHYKHILENNKLPDQRDITPWPGGLPNDIKHINDILAEEGRQLEHLLGGKGTLAQCISKEVFGDEDVELPISFTENNLERSLQIVADWTGFPIYIFQNCKENCSWELKTPITCVKATNCRYFITLFLQKENGNQYVDRIISKTGCNCMLAPPYVAKKVDENQDIGKEKRHRPLITFFPTNPRDKCFSDDVRKEINIIPIHSELRLVMERGDMEDRMIDTISDYTHSLYRCISKDIFGNEEQYQTIMEEVIAEIKENSILYGHLLIAEKESADVGSLSNFKYQERKVLDAFRFRNTILKESATFFTERIEDGMTLHDLELIAAATCFQVPIYVLSASIHEDRIETEWKLYSHIRRRKKPKDFLRRQIVYFANIDDVYKCLYYDNNVSKFHITLFRTFSGEYHRIAARYRVCNCLMDSPMAFVPQKHKHDNQADFRVFHDTNLAKSTLTTAKRALDMWMRCNMALEILCSEIIDELEGRRRNVNISTIVGSSVGIAGSALAIAGVIAAPFTAGVSLGLTVGGAVIGTLSGVTVVGSTVSEVVLNKDANAKFKRYYMNFCEQTRVLEDSLKKLQKIIQVIQERTLYTNGPNGIDATALQVAAGTLSMIRGIPIVVARIILSSASLADIVLPPLTAVLDVGFLVYSVHNLVKGSKTNVTEKMRSFRSILRASRTQLSIMAYGNKIKHFQTQHMGSERT
uniref:Apolipoprotein L3 n=1 Tax=Magallana gigas TaxID=29159 RepID=A0A8W8JJA3_MAGGI